jgi:hypothetical protein
MNWLKPGEEVGCITMWRTTTRNSAWLKHRVGVGWTMVRDFTIKGIIIMFQN